MATSANVGGLEALNRLKSVDPPLYLSPSSELSQAARVASQYLFSSIRPFAPKSPFDRLLTDGFDAEQIWQQIDLQSQPLISNLSRHVKNYEKHPDKISRLFRQIGVEKSSKSDKERHNLEIESVGLDAVEDDDMEEFDDDDDDDEEDEDEHEGEKGGERKKDDIDGNDDEEEEGGGLLEDKFLKIKELEEYLEEDEAREYGLKKNKKSDDDEAMMEESDEDGEGEENEGDEDEEDELEALGLDDDENGNTLETARYEDFFGGKNNSVRRKKPKLIDGSEDSDMFGDHSDDENLGQKKGILSTHERELEKQRSKIEQMEKANLEPKAWTMQGEVTAAKRPKNSALEVDLDFEHNVRPAPVITEEVTASLEELIQKRIAEGRFDDVQKPPTLPSKAPREIKELDENKSKKGLAEVYEEEYIQKSGLVSTALSFSDEQKKEATLLFKKLCLKLDALSHFHFTPKPVIEELSIRTNVPALAIEEIAPVAVSDAAMMAPEEVFTGKGDLKEETELTQAERKRRRANKKRKFKAETAKKMAKKAQQNTSVNLANGKED